VIPPLEMYYKKDMGKNFHRRFDKSNDLVLEQEKPESG